MANTAVKLTAGTFAVLGLLFLVVAALSPFLTAWAWNTVVPLLWKAAPHLNYWSALALNILLSTVASLTHGIFGRKD